MPSFRWGAAARLRLPQSDGSGYSSGRTRLLLAADEVAEAPVCFSYWPLSLLEVCENHRDSSWLREIARCATEETWQLHEIYSDLTA
jgi:hypothetical protein